MKIKYNDEKHYDGDPQRSEVSTVTCECGCDKLYVNFIPSPYCGCYLRLTCSAIGCGKSRVVFDDFS